MGVSNALLAFRAATTGAGMLSGNKTTNEAYEQISELAKYQTEKIKENTDARLEAMQTTFLYEIRDANNRMSDQYTNLTAQANDAKAKSLTNMAGAGVQMTESSYTQDVQDQIDDEYTSTLTTVSMAHDENFKRMEMMNQEKIQQTLENQMQKSYNVNAKAYASKQQLASKSRTSNIRNVGRLGSLGIYGYDKNRGTLLDFIK